MTTTPSTSPYLDHDTLLFVLEELNSTIKDTIAHQQQAIKDQEYEVATRHFFEGAALGAFWNRVIAAYKEQGASDVPVHK